MNPKNKQYPKTNKTKYKKGKKKRTHKEIVIAFNKEENKLITKKKFKNQDGDVQVELNISNFDFDRYVYLQNVFNFKLQYLDIKINLSYNIDVPDKKILDNAKEISKNNYFLYYSIIKHLSININFIREIDVTEYGNCYYNSLSKFFTGIENYNYFFRYILYKYCRDFKREIYNGFDLIDYFGTNFSTDLYFEKIKEPSFYAGDL